MPNEVSVTYNLRMKNEIQNKWHFSRSNTRKIFHHISNFNFSLSYFEHYGRDGSNKWLRVHQCLSVIIPRGNEFLSLNDSVIRNETLRSTEAGLIKVR